VGSEKLDFIWESMEGKENWGLFHDHAKNGTLKLDGKACTIDDELDRATVIRQDNVLNTTTKRGREGHQMRQACRKGN